ncbi:hypothetical protein IF1G_00601 [Cordyceps javanica]|uniref:Uncharacterized protein n=1 Tax=Cordyceps javanica TaxID=43265 RepID=A0A545VGB2_9HYPO|nr:hypothetical protein IF1G_00601 [Cordyceps javanica]TQW11851.1 hypothetical protein IF2G_00582 [Cordyceps javanica]
MSAVPSDVSALTVSFSFLYRPASSDERARPSPLHSLTSPFVCELTYRFNLGLAPEEVDIRDTRRQRQRRRRRRKTSGPVTRTVLSSLTGKSPTPALRTADFS